MEKWMVSSLVYRSGDMSKLFEEWHGLFDTKEEAEAYAKDRVMTRVRSIKIVNQEK